ncbi:MAG: hypothetical protein ACI9UN_005381, partial [Granulosicoccus sp.]
PPEAPVYLFALVNISDSPSLDFIKKTGATLFHDISAC